MSANKHAISNFLLKIRWLVALIGIFLIIIGQYLVAKTDPSAAPLTSPSKWLNNILHLGMPSIDSVLGGCLFLLIGGYLLAVVFHSLRLYSPDETLFENKPIRINLIRSAWPLVLIGSLFIIGLLFQLRKLDYHFYSPWLWVISLLIFSAVIARWDQLRGINLSPVLDRQDLIWLLGLLIAGLVIATYRLQGWPDQLMGDEGIFGSTARDIATGILKPPIFAQGVDTFPILSSIWQSLVMRIFGANIWGWRFGSILPGVLSVIPLYLLARDAFNKRIAVVSCAVFLTNPYFLVYSRLGYTNIQPVFIITSTLCLLYSGLRRTSNFFLFLAGCSAGLGFYTYFSGRSAFVIAILFVVLMWMTKKINTLKLVSTLGLFVLGSLLVAVPHIVYGINQNTQSMVYRIFLSFFNSEAYGEAYFPHAVLVKYAHIFQLGETDLFFNPIIYLNLILRGYIQTLLPYLKPGMLWGDHYLACPLAGTFGAIFFTIGLVVSLKNAKQSRFQLIILWFFTIITIFSALNTFPPREDHMVPSVPAMALLIGLGLDAVTETIMTIFSWLKKYINMLIMILLIIIMAGGLFDYFVTGPRYFTQKPEDIMSWTALDSHGESILDVYEVPVRPDFVPWVISEFRKDVDFKALQINEFLGNDKLIESGQKTIIFYPPEIDSKITPILQVHWGNSLIKRVFLDSKGNPVLMAGMNTPFIFERDRAFLETLFDAFHQIRFVVLLLALVILFLLAVFLPSPKLRLSKLHSISGKST